MDSWQAVLDLCQELNSYEVNYDIGEWTDLGNECDQHLIFHPRFNLENQIFSYLLMNILGK
jgi:hypothetical protein